MFFVNVLRFLIFKKMLIKHFYIQKLIINYKKGLSPLLVNFNIRGGSFIIKCLFFSTSIKIIIILAIY